MSHDIVERLRYASYENAPSRCLEAADEIERFHAARQKLQATYNDLLALQDQTDQVSLTVALDVVGTALAIIGNVR